MVLAVVAILALNVLLVFGLARAFFPKAGDRKPKLLVYKGPPMCGACEHFDREEAQRQFNTNPAFLAAAAVLSPCEMSAPKVPVETDEIVWDDHGMVFNADGTPKTERVVKMVPSPESMTPAMRRLKWDDAGACYITHDIRFPPMSCVRFSAKKLTEEELRRLEALS
jgi:hypothetical protein